MKQTFIILSVLAAFSLASCHSGKKAASSKSSSYSKTKSGIEYKMLYDKAGTNAKEGDFIEIHIRTSFNDSLIFDSKINNAGSPVTFPLNKPKFNGDLAEALMMMSPGDSMYVKVSVDSLKSAGQRTQPWMKDGGKIKYAINMVAAKSKEQADKDNAAGSRGQLALDDKRLQEYFTQRNLKPAKTATGLYYIITKPGTGANAQKGQTVYVNYTGHTIDGNVFDSNLDPKFNHVEPLTFIVGIGKVITGWDQGLQLLNKGAKATFYIPSTLAYGANKRSEAIPANSILIFDVELLDAK